MSKILETEFRTELYKSLCDAGYTKGEATSIVGVKYRQALRTTLLETLNNQIASINDDKNTLVINIEELTNGLSELAKLSSFFAKDGNKGEDKQSAASE